MPIRHPREFQEKSLEELRQVIKDERPFVNKRPFSHNIISLTLREIDRRFGKAESQKAIRELGLKRLGWSA